jgi:16S rRNA (cytidine1402-2'-O)-methyltransferase
MNSIGKLFLVSTPIGNLEDITLRAIRILKEVDFIITEDTRTAGKLLQHFDISKKIVSYYSYNEDKRIPKIIKNILEGKNVALISEAGTPLISDPGHKLVVAAIQNKIPVIPIPGVSALLTALVASGLPTDRFFFQGFLPRKKGRQTLFKKLSQIEQKTIEDIVKNIGNRYIVVARELTKKFEEIIRGYAIDIQRELTSIKVKGEIVLLVAGAKYKQNINSNTERLVYE